jgi:hypothetical protein
MLATSNDHYLVIKNQQLFELYIPGVIEHHYVTEFVREHMLELSKDNLGVILVYMHFKYIFDEVDAKYVNRFLS